MEHGYQIDGGLRVIDISNPTSPELVAEYETDDNLYQPAVAGDYLYTGSSDVVFNVWKWTQRGIGQDRNLAQSLPIRYRY